MRDRVLVAWLATKKWRNLVQSFTDRSRSSRKSRQAVSIIVGLCLHLGYFLRFNLLGWQNKDYITVSGHGLMPFTCVSMCFCSFSFFHVPHCSINAISDTITGSLSAGSQFGVPLRYSYRLTSNRFNVKMVIGKIDGFRVQVWAHEKRRIHRCRAGGSSRTCFSDNCGACGTFLCLLL